MSAFNYKSVLVPNDFSEQSHNAVELALEIVDEPSQLTVLHVAPPMNTFSVGDPAIAWDATSDKDRTEHLCNVFRKHFEDPKFQGVNFEVVFGSPAAEITRFAQDHLKELIVLPSHGRTGLARVMIGSVAERVVRLAHCPVLVLRD